MSMAQLLDDFDMYSTGPLPEDILNQLTEYLNPSDWQTYWRRSRQVIAEISNHFNYMIDYQDDTPEGDEVDSTMDIMRDVEDALDEATNSMKKLRHHTIKMADGKAAS